MLAQFKDVFKSNSSAPNTYPKEKKGRTIL